MKRFIGAITAICFFVGFALLAVAEDKEVAPMIKTLEKAQIEQILKGDTKINQKFYPGFGSFLLKEKVDLTKLEKIYKEGKNIKIKLTVDHKSNTLMGELVTGGDEMY